jgi:P27 family predicted phage terminase small subunit
MGRRGPKKTPAATHKKRGTFQPSRHSGPDSKPVPGIPEPPADLTEAAREAWISIAGKLLDAKLLTALDDLALRLMAESVDMYLRAGREIEHWGLTSVTDKGNTIQHPAVAVRNKAWSQIVKLCQEFGMTPAARTGLAVDVKASSDGKTEAMAKILGFKVTG